ncbi:MAG: dockerin type I repeat-containing protein [Chthoniobacterales bacterium]
MKSPRLSIAARGFLLLASALALSSPAAFGQSVSGFLLGKIQNFQQTSFAAPVANSTQPFQFGGLINAGTATINSASMTFTGSSSPRVFTAAGLDFSILDTFTTQAMLDAAYGSGNYNLSINTSAGVLTRTIFLFPFSYPTTARLTVAAGDWQNNVLVLNSAQDYTFTWGAFANAQTADLIQFAIRGSSVNLAPFPATQTSYTLPAGTLQPGTDYVCDLAFIRVAGATAGDTNIGSGYATLVKDTGFTIHTPAPAFAVTAAVSEKTHGASGTFDIPLPAVECRSGGANGDHTLVVAFTNNVLSGNATLSTGTGSIVGAPTITGNMMTINLTGVTNAETVILTLDNVTDSFSQVLPATMLTARFLFGDTNGNGTVNATDVSQTKAIVGQTLDATNFRGDFNLSGAINATDVGAAKAAVGTALPGALSK